MIPQCYFDFEDLPCQRQKTPIKPMQQMPMNMNQGQVPPGYNDNFQEAPGSPTILGKEYTQGYLKSIIGKRIRVMFLIGTNIIQDRDGILQEVGISYIVIKETETNNLVLCDIYAIKFVTVY